MVSHHVERVRELFAGSGVAGVVRGVDRFLRWRAWDARRALFAASGRPETLLPRYIALKSRLFPGRYTDADPFEVRWIDPAAVERSYEFGYPPEFGRCRGGDWDETAERFTDRPVYTSLERHFRDSVPWPETEVYRERVAQLEREGSAWDCSTRAELDARFADLDDLYRSMSEHGYRSQRELVAEDPEAAFTKNNDGAHPYFNEIGVSIARDGSFVYSGPGKHRMAIAKLLELDAVAIHVRTRHASWQRVRDAYRTAASPADLPVEVRQYRDHPDLRELLD